MPMRERAKPKPCPFCGAGARVFGKFSPQIRCNRQVACGTIMRPLWPATREEVIAMWNRRPS